MNAIPMNLVLAEKEAAKKIAENQETDREKSYQERKKICEELHKKKINFNPSASLKELQKLVETKAKDTPPQKPKTADPSVPSQTTGNKDDEPSGGKEPPKVNDTDPDRNPAETPLETLRQKAATLGLKPPRLYTLSMEGLKTEITKLETQKKGSDSPKTNAQKENDK